jgi:outer membrane protein OmpA-like peptidoglycan-associated protein
MKTIIQLSFIFLLFAFKSTPDSYTIENNELILPYPIVFKTGTAELSPESDSALIYIKNYLNDKTYISKLRIEGHTDNMGNHENNQLLSEKRSMAVGRWLVNNDIDCKRLICVGFGGTHPKASDETPEGRAANTRIGIMNASLRGVPISGLPIDGGGIVAGNLCNR